ncbi:MAG TPA: shikimate kinase [Candidatus Krumholzibacteria bacterium]|nr:shikimate kinase [Candidatus Krumholzibacteria bacterium]
MWLSLIGFMGSGKSSVAAALAERAVADALDLDALIEARAGRSVAAVFDAEGEAGFRDLEAAVLADLPADEELILACGGGVVEREENRELLRRRGVVVWLDAPWEALLGRLEQVDLTARPLLRDGDWARVEALYHRRRPLYARTAHFRLRCDRASADVVARRALACRLEWKRARPETQA